MVLTMESMSTVRSETKRPSAVAAVRLGERLRQLRVAAGLTQSELAGDRFSKEYVSQIERGKTRPTAETVEWLAGRLGVDVGFLANGVSTEHRHRVEAGLTRAEALADAGRFEEALAAYGELAPAVAGTGSEELEVRAACGEWRGLAWARRGTCSRARRARSAS